jgi:guanylate kinase
MSNLFLITGPSGVGKTALLESLLLHDPNVGRAITTTTRKPRPGETHRLDYYFVDSFTFDTMLHQGQMIEHTEVHGNMYGLTAQEIDSKLRVGMDVLVILDPIGTQIVRERYSEAVTIFIAPASVAELEWRLDKRDSDTRAARELRRRDALKWMTYIGNYDFLVQNRTNEFTNTVQQLYQVILADRLGFNNKQPDPKLWEEARVIAKALIPVAKGAVG